MTSLTLLPAVDVAAGRAAQVVPGVGHDRPDDARLLDEPDDPRAVAWGWVRGGARWLHVVDLDRAHRRGHNADLLNALVGELPVPVQVSGGIEDQESLDWALASGAARVNLASTALRDPDWVRAVVRRHGARIAVGIDVQDDEVVARGVKERIGLLQDVLPQLAGLSPAAFVVADASRDGRRSGADVDLFRQAAQQLQAPVIASGGVRDVGDVRALRSLTDDGVVAVILGSALYHGTLTLAQALEAAQ